MADNYLERKMDDYRRGTPAKRRLTHTGDVPGVLRVKLQPRPVLLLNASTNAHETLVSMLCGAGFRVAFTAADPVWGRGLAGRVGALFLPSPEGAVELLCRHWRCSHVTRLECDDSGDASAQAYALRVIADIMDSPLENCSRP